MKITTKYNLKRNLVILGLGALTLAFAGCEKEKTESNNPSNPQQPQKHNVELTYGTNPNTQWQNIEMDTIYKYNADTTVDTIFMIPESANQYASTSANGCKTLVGYLRTRHNVNPNKVFGKGDFVLNSGIINNHPEIVRFFADTLKYNVRN